MADGSIQKIERDRILLKENAVPSLFPDLPHYLSSKTKNRKPPVQRLNIECNKNIIPETHNLDDSLNEIIEYDAFTKIENQLKNTILPDTTFISKLKDDLIIGWFNNDNDTVFKKIIIYKSNFKIQVSRMYHRIINNNLNLSICSIKNAFSSIYYILGICKQSHSEC